MPPDGRGRDGRGPTRAEPIASPSMAERLVVIGGDAGGMTAATNARAAAARPRDRGLRAGHPHQLLACGIPYLVVGRGRATSTRWSPARPGSSARPAASTSAIAPRGHGRSTSTAARSRCATCGHDRTFRIGFDQLLIGTGARPIRPDLPGIDGEQVRGVQTLDDGADLLAFAEAEPVPAGRGRRWRLHRARDGRGLRQLGRRGHGGRRRTPHVMRTLDPDMADARRGRARAARRSTLRTRRRGSRRSSPARCTPPTAPIPADLVVLGLGVTPNSELAEAAGIELGARGAISVDRRQRTSVDGVWAAGDCAESFHLVSRRPVHVALGTVANRQGRVAGINIGGGYATFPGVLGTAVTKVCEHRGRPHRADRGRGRAATASTPWPPPSRARPAPATSPGPQPITVKLVVERRHRPAARRPDRRRRGLGQAHRHAGHGASRAGMTRRGLVDLDLAYAPPFSPVWDPVATSPARRGAAALRRDAGLAARRAIEPDRRRRTCATCR